MILLKGLSTFPNFWSSLIVAERKQIVWRRRNLYSPWDVYLTTRAEGIVYLSYGRGRSPTYGGSPDLVAWCAMRQQNTQHGIRRESGFACSVSQSQWYLVDIIGQVSTDGSEYHHDRQTDPEDRTFAIPQDALESCLIYQNLFLENSCGSKVSGVLMLCLSYRQDQRF